jgi:hypothetical protein
MANRTPDLVHAKHTLYQLSYNPLMLCTQRQHNLNLRTRTRTLRARYHVPLHRLITPALHQRFGCDKTQRSRIMRLGSGAAPTCRSTPA